MATRMQLAQIQELDIEKRCRVSLQLADSQRQNILDQDEEGALVVAAKSGDGHAFEILIERHQRRVLAVARRFTRIREDAEDIVQQSLQKAFVHLHKLEGKSCFSTWLTRIAINEALMLLRRGRGLREVSIEDLSGNEETALGLQMPDSRPGPESAFLQGERNRILYEAMDKLTSGIRTAIELRDLGELSTKEVARVLGLSIEAVKGRVYQGRRKLHKVLKRESAWMYGKQILRASRKANGISRDPLVGSTCNWSGDKGGSGVPITPSGLVVASSWGTLLRSRAINDERTRERRFQRNRDGKETMSLQRALSRTGLMRPNGAVGF